MAVGLPAPFFSNPFVDRPRPNSTSITFITIPIREQRPRDTGYPSYRIVTLSWEGVVTVTADNTRKPIKQQESISDNCINFLYFCFVDHCLVDKFANGPHLHNIHWRIRSKIKLTFVLLWPPNRDYGEYVTDAMQNHGSANNIKGGTITEIVQQQYSKFNCESSLWDQTSSSWVGDTYIIYLSQLSLIDSYNYSEPVADSALNF